MSIAIVTGAAGLVGSESVRFLSEKGFEVIGIDNDMRSYFFGNDASTLWQLEQLKKETPRFRNESVDIRDYETISGIFKSNSKDIRIVVHAAAQPSHDWAAREPITDFEVNALGTLHLLEATRLHAPDAVFIFTSTNKVYGDSPNSLPLVECESRWEIDPTHPFAERGIDETMSIDKSKHSIFGASKVAADVLVQEYGRYFGLRCGVFRGGCLTGPAHSGAELHGFLGYLMKCAATGKEYRVLGYKGKQVRDNIHSWDLVDAFYHFYTRPRCGEVYNIGGSRFSHCSMLEAIGMCEEITGRPMKVRFVSENRQGDHIWWVSDMSKFKAHFPTWSHTRGVKQILSEIFESNEDRWRSGN